MRVIIAGSRTISDPALVDQAVADSGFEVTVVLSGGAAGVDRLGEDWAARNGVPIERYPAQWDLYGKRAGKIRNQQMAEAAEGLIAIWDGSSRGTFDMLDRASVLGLKVHILLPK